MKILFTYLKPYKWLVILTLALAGINIGFSLFDPILLGKLVNLASDHQASKPGFSDHKFFWDFSRIARKEDSKYLQLGVYYILILSISVAMVSRIAKAFQDYFL